MKHAILWSSAGEPEPALLPRVQLPASVDVAVVGGGLTGLSAA